MGRQTHGGTLAAGASYTGTVTETLPDGLSGTYYLFVLTDSSGEVHRATQRYAEQAQCPGGHPSLVAPGRPGRLRGQRPATGSAGGSVTVNWTVTNQGTGDTVVTSWSDAVYLNSGETLAGDPVFLGVFPHSGLLDAGHSYSQSQPVTLPQGLAGSYNLFVVTNVNGAVYEGTNTGNDTSAPVPISIELPDLIVSAASAPATATSGSALLVSWTVTNQGIGGTEAASWQDNVYADVRHVGRCQCRAAGQLHAQRGPGRRPARTRRANW